MGKADYTLITETPGLKATAEQAERLYHRYCFSRQFVNGNDVLEIACGSGIGLGYLSGRAKRVAGIDIEEKNVAKARAYYRGRPMIEARVMDAHKLRYPDESFDIALLHEALYYLNDPAMFVAESSRVLRPAGRLVISTVNRCWRDFHPSPFAQRYFSIAELYDLLRPHFSEISLYGAFPAETGGIGGMVSFLKRGAVRFNLIPGSLRARAYLKRIFIGRLKPLPEEVFEEMAQYIPPSRIRFGSTDGEYKIIYAVARK
jgi:SAM-dependent methyltransferase